MRFYRFALPLFAFALFAVASAGATTDEGVLGRYSFADPAFSISFDWQLDSLHGLRVKSKYYSQDIPLTPNGLNGEFYSYDANIPCKSYRKQQCVLHLDAMVNSDDAPMIVNGIYIELAADKSEVARVIYRKAFILHCATGAARQPGAGTLHGH